MAVQTSVGPGQKAEDRATGPTPRLINIIDRSSGLTALTQKVRGHIPVRRIGSHQRLVDRVVGTGGYSKNLIISSLARGPSYPRYKLVEPLSSALKYSIKSGLTPMRY